MDEENLEAAAKGYVEVPRWKSAGFLLEWLKARVLYRVSEIEFASQKTSRRALHAFVVQGSTQDLQHFIKHIEVSYPKLHITIHTYQQNYGQQESQEAA